MQSIVQYSTAHCNVLPYITLHDITLHYILHMYVIYVLLCIYIHVWLYAMHVQPARTTKAVYIHALGQAVTRKRPCWLTLWPHRGPLRREDVFGVSESSQPIEGAGRG